MVNPFIVSHRAAQFVHIGDLSKRTGADLHRTALVDAGGLGLGSERRLTIYNMKADDTQ